MSQDNTRRDPNYDHDAMPELGDYEILGHTHGGDAIVQSHTGYITGMKDLSIFETLQNMMERKARDKRAPRRPKSHDWN